MTQRECMVGVDKKVLGVYLRALRDGRGLSRKQLRDITDIHVSQIERYETGKQSPSFEYMAIIMHALDISLDGAAQLVLDSTATEEFAERLAAAHLATRPDDTTATMEPQARRFRDLSDDEKWAFEEQLLITAFRAAVDALRDQWRGSSDTEPPALPDGSPQQPGPEPTGSS